MPGGVDPHAHFALPMMGTISADDHYSGHKAAAFGGTTTVIDFVSLDQPTLGASVRAWHEIADHKPVYSFDLLEALQAQVSTDDQLYLVIGPDNAAAFDKFHRADEIRQHWQLLVMKERISVRSTAIRAALSQHQSISNMTTPSVAEFLAAHSVYCEATS